MKHPRVLTVVLAILVCGGCASAPIHYYTLIPPISASSELASAACCIVQLRVLIRPEVDRAEIVTRSGEEQAVVLSNETWLAPLRDEIRGALISQINLKLLEGAAIEPVARVKEPVILVNITRFEAVPAQYVLVTANWRIQRAEISKPATLTCEITTRIAVKNGVSALVQGYQQALIKIADRIALDIPDAGQTAAQHCATPP